MSSSASENGIVRLKSAHSVAHSIDRLESLVRERGLMVFARIDFSGDAARAGLALADEQMLIFGNPKAGTALMQENALAGLDLPLKVLAWQDAQGQTWLAYNDPGYVIARHGLSESLTANLGAAHPLIESAAG